MANDLVRFATGLESNLSQEAKEKGKILFAVTGDNKGYIYFDKDNNTRIKMSEHALTAEKDAANNTITTTYLKSIAQNSSTINTYSIKSIAGANTTKDIITIPNASTTKAGLITGEAQTLGGDKTFNNSVTINDKLTVNEDIISLAGEPYMAQKEYTNILCTANNDPNGYLYYGQLKLKDYYTEWYLKLYISMDIPYDSTKANTNNASYEGIVEYWGYANIITATRVFNAHANTSYRTFYSHQVYRTTLAGCQTYGNLLGFRFYSSWNPATAGYGRNIKIKVIHTDNCSFNFLDNMVLYANAPGTGSTNFTGRSEYDGWNNGLRESGDDNTRNHLIGAQYLRAGESCIDRYTIVMQEKGGDFSSICYKNATSNVNDTATNHIKSTSHYVVGGPVYYAYSNAHTNAGALSSSQEFHTNYPLTFTYSSNSGATLTNGKMVYLKFGKDSEGYLTIPDHPWYSQELPTEEDGYVYMSLGIAYSTSQVYMFPEHEYYEYIAGQIRKYVHNLPVKQGGTGKTSWTANQIVYASAATTLSQLPSGTDGQLLKSKGANAAPEWISPSSLLVGKATGDSAGDNIRSTYIKGLSVSGTTLTITKGDNSTSTLTLQDTNTDTKVTNTLNTTTKAYVTGTTSATTNTGTQIFDTGVYLDTTVGQLVATKFVGALQGNADTATKATGDSAGDNIRTTYIKGLSLNGLTLTVTKGDNSSSTLTLQDLDVKVNMKARGTTKAYLLGTVTSPTSSDQAVTSVAETGVYFDTTAGKLVATTFKGALEGNADTATALKNGHTFKITDDSSTNTGNTVAFNGTQDVTLKLPADVKFSNITATSNITVNTGNIDIVNVKETDKFINLYFDANKTSGASWRLGHIGSGSGDTNYFVIQSGTSTTGTTEWHNVIRLGMNSYDAHFGGNVNPLANNTQTLGTTSLKWKNVYATTFTGDLTGTAAKATGDGAGDNIRSTYIKSLSVSGTTLTITKGDSTTSTITLQDTNTDTKVTNTLGTTTKAYVTGTTSATTNTGTQIFDTGVYLDTTAGQLVATTFKGALDGNASTATKATGDSAGDNIRTTYIKSLSVSGTTLTITKGDNSTSTITLQDTNTDTKVTNTLGTTTKAYVTGTTSATTNTGTQIFDTGVYLDTTAGQLVATTFKGALDGNASTATKATGDSAGDNIRSTYIKGLSVDGTTLTITKGDNSTSTITLQDTNTDTKVTNTLNTTAKAYITGTTSATTNTGTQVFDTGVYLDTTAGHLVATTFKGNLAWTYLTSVPTLVKSAYGTAATDKYTIQLYNQNGATIASTTTVTTNGVITIPAATISQAGLITSTDQSIAGSKTFTGTSTTIGRNIIRNTTDAPDQGDIILSVFGYKTGYPVYADPLFESGNNSAGRYNNSGNENVTITRDTYTNFGITSPGTGSNYVLRIQNTGTASPGLGGFVQSITSRANAQFIQIFRALVPVGYSLYIASNNMGDQYKDHWITSSAGTGKWEWYARRVLCGKEGTFSGGGHVFINGTPAGTTSAPVSFYLSYCQLYDLTKAKYDGLRTRYADNADSATSATKATNDGANNQITTTYLKAVSITGNDTTDIDGTTAITAGSKGFYTVTTGANASTKYALPIAGESVAGIITNTAQTFGGNKTFKGLVTFSTANGFTYSGIGVASDNAARPVWFSYNGVTGRPVYDNDFKYNPSTNTLTVTNVTGTAAKATADAANNTITTTYLAKISENSSTINTYSIKSSVGGNLSGTKDTVTIPNASTTKAGLITGEAQTLGGDKTFNDEVIVKDMLKAEADIVSANGYPYIEKKTYTDIIATANSTANGCFYLADIRPDNFYEAWSIRLLVHAYVSNHKEYDSLHDITISGYYSVSGSNYFWNVVYSNFNSLNTSYRPFYYSDIRTLNKTGYDAGSPILWGVDLYASTNPTNTDYKRTIDVTLLDVENCTFTFKDTPIVYANVPNTSHYYTYYSMDCANIGLRESADNDTYDRTYATNYVRVGSSPIHRYSLIMQDTTDGFSSLVYKTKNSNNNDNATSGHVAATDVHFIPTGQILWNSTGNWYNTSGSQTGSIGMYTAIPIDFRYASNCSASLTIGKPVYYIFNKNIDDNTLSIDSTIHTQTLPTTEDGKVYMFLGIAYATTHIYLHHVHPMYEFIDGKLRPFREVIPIKQGGTGKSSWTANGLVYASGSTSLSQIGTGTDGQFLKSKGANAAPVWTNASDIAVNKAEKDGAGNTITTHYIKHGSIEVSDTNHNMIYTNGANGDTQTVSLPFVKLSGDTMTGLLTLKAGQNVHSATGVAGTGGYVKIATLVIGGTYQNQPITMEISRRGDNASTILNIQFQNSSTTDPSLISFNYFGPCSACFIKKSAASTWDLYVQKSENHDNIYVTRYHKPYNNSITLTWKNELLETAIDDWTQASLIAKAASADKAEKDGAGHVITTQYIKHGSILVSDTNHNMTYQNGASGDTKTVSLPFVKLSGDTMTGDLLVQRTSGDTKVGVKNTNGNVELLVSTNRGIYDRTSQSWMIYRGPSGTVTYLLSGTGTKNWQFNDNGNLTTPGGATATANMIGTASRAVGDSAGNQITTTYLKSITITGNNTTDTDDTTTITAGSKGFYTVTTGANASTKYVLPIAGESVAGIIVNTAQTWKGVKTFSTGVTVSATGGFEYSGIETGTSAGARPVWYSYLGKNGRPVIDASHFTYNPGTQTLTVANLNGLAAKATADAANNTITTTYLAKISENSSTINTYSIKSSVGGNLSGTKDTVTIPNASTTKAGLITGEAQTLGGDKTFNDEVIVKDVLTSEKDIISANGYPYIKKKTFTDIIATENNTANGCFYLANIRPNNFYESWNFRAFVHAYVPNHPEYNGLYDITVTGHYAISGSVKYWAVVYSNFCAMNTSYRPIYYSSVRTLNETGYNANSPILWGVDLYASTNPTNTDYKRTVEVTLLDVENCTFDFRDTPLKYANTPNTTHYYTNYSTDCVWTGLRESSDNDTTDRTYATNYVRVGSSPIHRYSLIMQDTTDGFSSLVYKSKNSNNNDNAASGHVAATDVHFIPTGQILWNSSGSFYSTSGSQTGSIAMYTAIPFDFRYASNCSASLTIGKPVYYIFNKNIDDNTLSIDSTIYTQTLPTTEDGKVYIFLGIAYSTTNIYLHHVHSMYEFIDGKLRTYRETIPVKQGGTGKSSWTANGLVYASGTSTLGQIGTGTDGQFLKSKGANAAPEWTDASDIAVNKAERDGAGNVITTHYIKHGSIEVSDTNHNMTYTNGANGDTQTVSLPFVKLSGDTMTGDLLVQKTSGDAKVGVKNNNGNVELLASTNRGVYDRTTSSWIVYRSSNGTTTYIVNGSGSKMWTFDNSGNLTTPAGATATANLIGTASRAVGDGAGHQITTTYAEAGSFATDTANHKITYTDGANTSKEFSTPFVLQAGDSMTGNLTTTGNMTAVKFIGALQGNADSASTLSHKTLSNTTLENTAGSFAFSGAGLPWDNTDWVGLQIGDSVDKFQIVANDGGLLFRQNDSGGTATSGWTSWARLAYAPINTQVGSSTKGVYVSNKGVLTACSYELKATVNNATQYGVAYYSTTTNITSTAAGGANTALMGKGSAAPAFVSVSPTLTLTAGTTAGPKVKITVLGVAGTDLQLPSAGSGASGVVTTDTQTFAGAKTFSNSITVNGNVDSTDSLSTSASLVVKGGVSVAKNLSAKTIRIDNNQTTEGVQLQYDETLDTLNFVFV